MDIKVDTNTVIVFDLDDTLYNELDFLKSAYKEIAKTLDENKWKPLYTYMFSLYRSKENVFKILADNYSTEINKLILRYRNHKPKIQLFDGALDLLISIKALGGKIGLITDGRVKTQMEKIETLGIIDLIDKVVISGDIGTEKPNILNFQTIENSIRGKEYYYIADNFKKDFVTPNALGWQTIGCIDNGKNVHFESFKYFETEYAPKHLIFSFKEISII